MLAAFETGITESSLRNLNYGDADSQGWRQERAQFYKNPTNLGASVNRYFQETDSEKNNYRTPAALSQAVQRSAFPERYAQNKDEALRLLKATRGGGGGGGGLKDPGRPPKTTVSRPEVKIPGQSMAAERSSARRALLMGGDLNFQTLLQYKSQIDQLKDVPGRTVSGDLQVDRDPGKKPKLRSGSQPPGKKATGPQGLEVSASRIKRGQWGGSRLAGKALALASGLPVSSRKRSTVNTASGGVSDHWDGNKDSYAWDLTTSGEQGTKIARKMARMLGQNWQGGSWLNVNKKIGGVMYRFQIGWNVADHYDHIHMGVDRADTPG